MAILCAPHLSQIENIFGCNGPKSLHLYSSIYGTTVRFRVHFVLALVRKTDRHLSKLKVYYVRKESISYEQISTIPIL